VTRSRQSRVVLVELEDEVDPETGERYTVKRYTSEKVEGDEGGWRHISVTLRPENRRFSPVVLLTDDEERLRLVGEFLQVLGDSVEGAELTP